MMDEEMEELVGGGGFGEFEVDFEYEYDAPGFFDFTHWESAAEARESERWFESARSYPPSPYVVRLSERECVPAESSRAEKPEVQGTYGIFQSLYSVKAECFEMDECKKGSISYDHVAKEISKPKMKLLTKARFVRSSTLMKPTASQLAKQNRVREVNASSQLAQRFDQPLALKAGQILEKPTVSENQASKRQKLDGGLLCKVLHMQQQSNLAHKVSRKNMPTDGHSELSRRKLTIPREPELVTAQRAQKMRPKHGTDLADHAPRSTQMFRARPLNRKIFEAPSIPLRQKSTPQLPVFQEFSLKTSERAMQHISAASSTYLAGKTINLEFSLKTSERAMQHISAASSTYLAGKTINHVVQKDRTTNFGQSSAVDSKKLQCPPTQSQREHQEHECDGTAHKFKARPLNQKIFLSKGDMGVFVTSKPQLTTPVAFSFSTDKRFQQNPPTELFSKLSLTSDIKHTISSEPKILRPPRTPVKVSKENISDSSQQEFKGLHSSRAPMQGHGRNITNTHGNNRTLIESRSRENMCRVFGIR